MNLKQLFCKLMFIAIFILISISTFSLKAQLFRDSILKNEEKTIYMNEVIVTGTRSEAVVRNLPMSVSIITDKQILERQSQSVIPLLNELVPGLFITGRGIMGYGISTGAAGTMKMRGIGGNPTTGVLILIDGEPQFMGLMGHPIADLYQSVIADRIEVVRGPASALYGSNAMGGVINIITSKFYKDTVQQNFHFGYGSYSTLESSASNHFHKNRITGKFAISYNRTDGHRENMDFDQISGYAKLGYRLDRYWSVSTNANISHFNASNPGTVDQPIVDNDSHVKRGWINASVENRYRYTSGALSFFYNWGNHIINDGYNMGGQPLDYLFHSNDKISGITFYQSAILMPNNKITFGFDYQKFGGKAWNKYNDGNKKSIIDTTLYEIAGYADMRQDFGLLATVDIGIRLDNHSKTGSQWIPQVGLSFHLPKNIEAKTIVGKGFRNPTIRELFMFTPQNPNLLPEEVMNYEFSVSQNMVEKNLFYDVAVFYLEGKNMIQTVISNGRPINVNTGKIKNFGFESVITYQINSIWSANVNYSWLDMKYPVTGAPKQKVFAGFDYSKKKLKFSSGIQYVHRLYSSLNPVKKENFTLLNARTTYQLGKFTQLFLTGENLLNCSYEINAGYPMPKATFLIGCNVHF